MNLDNVNLYFGDCLRIMDDFYDSSVNMILCDLPYGVTKNKWDSQLPLDKLWEQYIRIIKDNGAIVLFAQGMFTAKLMVSNSKMWRYNLVWHKTQPSGFLNANRMPLRGHEDICVFYKKLPKYNPQKSVDHERKISTASHKTHGKVTSNYNKGYEFTTYDSTERYPTSIITVAKDIQKSKIHPTQKPVKLCEYLIKTYTDEGEVVLDNCMGSGSTGVACINTNRSFIGIENDKYYFNKAKERINKTKGKK